MDSQINFMKSLNTTNRLVYGQPNSFYSFVLCFHIGTDLSANVEEVLVTVSDWLVGLTARCWLTTARRVTRLTVR